jgi:hypothetical protein
LLENLLWKAWRTEVEGEREREEGGRTRESGREGDEPRRKEERGEN